MITLTDVAASQLRTLLQKQGTKGAGLRIFVQGGGCAGFEYGLKLEEGHREQDTVLEDKGIRLFVDPFSLGMLEGACIDFQDTELGTGFRVDNPNAAATCACGSSFRTEGGLAEDPYEAER